MKFRITKNAWTSGKNKLQTDAELKQFSAYSYDWWQYVATDAVGNVYFNNSKYSNTTSGHQGETLGILRSVGIRVDFEVGSTLEHFGRGIDSVLQAEIKELQKKNADLKTSIDTPRSHKRKNAERRETIKANEYRIKDIERILTEYLDKKRIPQPKLKPIEALITALELDNGTAWYETERQNDLNNLEIYKQYFKKPNGTVQINELTALINRVTRRWGGIQNAPAINQIDTLRELLSLKPSESIEFLLIYPHTKDIPGMLPHADSAEYLKFKAWVAKTMETQPKNPLLMEKIHAKLINAQNKRTYTPREALQFPVHPSLVALDAVKHERLDRPDHLRLIQTDRDLRAEGKRQGHCIGSKDYIQRCASGQNHALNFKGYTFLLDASLSVAQTNGRHNSQTPETVKQELLTLLKAVA